MEEEKPINKSQSRVCMTLTSSSGEWLNGCLQPQHYYVSLEVTDPEGKALARVGLSYEQAARMLLYNGDVECTLTRYRDEKGKLVSEKVTPPETVYQRMRTRMGNTHKSLVERMEDIRKDIYDMINGNIKPGKTNLSELLQEVETLKTHFVSNQSFVVQQAEEELGQMESNAIGQVGTFLQSKYGVEASSGDLKGLLTTGAPALLGSPIQPVADDYSPKERASKSIEDMTPMEVADALHRRLKYIEATRQSNNMDKDADHTCLYNSSASCERKNIVITYIGYQGHNKVDLETAKRYLKFLLSTEPKKFKRHWDLEKE